MEEKQLKLFIQSEEKSNSDNNTLNKENNNFKTEKIKTKNEYKKYSILKMQEEIDLKGFYIFKEKNKDYFNLYTFNFGIIFYFFISFIIIFFGTDYLFIIFYIFIIILGSIDLIKKKNHKIKKYLEDAKLGVPFFVGIFIGIFNIFIYNLIITILKLDYHFNYSIFLLGSTISVYFVYVIFRNEDLKNYKIIFENGITVKTNPYKLTKKEKNFFIIFFNQEDYFKINFIKLEDFTEVINKKRKNINNNLKNLEFYELKNEINYLSKYINKSYKIKDEIKESLLSKKYFPEEKFENYLKENIIFPLKEIKKILENNLISIENLKSNTSENPQIILANKRLEIQKNSLKEQILLLDEKMKKLEN